MEGQSQYPGQQQHPPQQATYQGQPVVMATPIATTYGYQQPPPGYYAGTPQQMPPPGWQPQAQPVGYGGGPYQHYPQPTVVYIQQQRPVMYGYTYSERARMVYWGNPWVRAMTLMFIAFTIIGIVLIASSPSNCPNGCQTSTCTSVNNNDYPCTCDNGTTCRDYVLAAQGQAGDALLSIGIIGLIIQSFVACGCCGQCWGSCQPPPPQIIQNPQHPPMMAPPGTFAAPPQPGSVNASYGAANTTGGGAAAGGGYPGTAKVSPY